MRARPERRKEGWLIIQTPNTAPFSLAPPPGIQTLLPLFKTLSTSKYDPSALASVEPIIPTLFFLLASFLRASPINQASLYNAGGVQIIEAALSEARCDDHMLVCRYDR